MAETFLDSPALAADADPAGASAIPFPPGIDSRPPFTVEQQRDLAERVDRFFERSPDLLCLVGFDGRLRRVNPACARLSGIPAADLLSRHCLELVHPADRLNFARQLTRLRRGEDITGFEMRCVRRDGETIWTHWNAISLASHDEIIATGHDITGRKRAEEAVRQSEEHYRELFHEAYQMQQNLRLLSDRILEVQEQERARLSRELHDEAGQALTAVGIHLGVLHRSLDGAYPDLAKRAFQAAMLLKTTAEAVHRVARDLRPAMLDDLGLLPALRSYVKAYTERTALPVEFTDEAGGNLALLDAEGSTVVYRVVQEGLNNIAKHAQATRVELGLSQSPARVHVRIQDNGRGFDARAAAGKPTERLGLLGIKERVRLVNGTVAIESQPGAGTEIRISIPVKVA